MNSVQISNNIAILPVTLVIPSAAITTAFATSNVKTMYNEKQGGSTLGTAIRSSVQVVTPATVGSVSLGIAAAAGLGFFPVTLFIMGSAIVVGSVCGGVTLGATLYYNKFFVAKKLRSIEESVKKISQEGLSLDQKKLLIGLINNSLTLLNGDKEKGLEKSNKKIKKLDSKILFNLIEIKNILSSADFTKNTKQRKDAQKHCKKMNKEITELLEHSLLFSILINDVNYIKEIYTRLNLLKEGEHTDKNIQNILAKINPTNHSAIYGTLLERFKEEQNYTASKKGKLRAAVKAIISCIPERKEFVQLHEEVIALAAEINEDYQELKKIIPLLQKQVDAFKSPTSKHQLFDIYAAFKALSYRDVLERNIASLTRSKEHEFDVNPDFNLDFDTVSTSMRLRR